MVATVVSFFLGILSLLFFQELPSLISIIYGSAGLTVAVVILQACISSMYPSKKGAREKHQEYIFVIGIAFISGFIWIWVHSFSIIQSWIPTSIEGKIIEVVGTIKSLPIIQKETAYFNLDVHQAYPSNLWPKTGMVKARWHLPPDLQIGETWQLSIRIKKPRGYSNPGSFDLERHFFQKSLVAEGTVIETATAKKIKNSSPQYGTDCFRVWLMEKMKLALANHEFSGILVALAVGIQEGISNDQWDILRKTGTAHLVAISGLHVGLIAGFVYFLSKILVRLMPVVLREIPISIICSTGALIASFLYALLAGLAVSTQRALLMIVFVTVNLLQKRMYLSSNTFFKALGVVLILDPLSVLNMGFWLSFGAVALILYGMKGRLNPTGFWWQWGRTQWLVSLGLIPLTLGFFNTVSLVSPLANFIAIPWVSFLVVPFCLIGSISVIFSATIGTLFLTLANQLLVILWPILEGLSNIPNATFVNGYLSLFNLSILMIGVLLLLLPRGFPGKYIGVIWVLPIFLAKPLGIEKGTAKITILDVGQGLASVVETQNHVLVFDTGPKLSDQFDTGDKVVLPYLATRGIRKIDLMIISHLDNDHAGGADSLLKKIAVNKVMGSEKLFLNKEIDFCYAGQYWEWDGVRFEMLHPSSLSYSKRNERSCVLRVQAGVHSVLLTADIEAKSEQLLTEKVSGKLAATVMVVPHHGSLSSSTHEFIRWVSPRYAIIPAGYLNAYGHPKQEIVKRYQQKGIAVFDTIKEGAVSFVLNDKAPLTLELYRTHEKKFWHGQF